MNLLNIDDLIAVIADMLSSRLTALQATALGRGYEPLLRARLEELRALPEAMRGLPLAALLGVADGRFDENGAALDELLGALERLSLLSDTARASARELRSRFIPARAILGAKHADEAAHARKVRPAVAENEAALRAIPLPEDHTLFDVAEAFVSAGEEIGRLLSQRADRVADATRGDAARLRAKAIRTLGRLREDIDEVRDADPTVPRDIDARLFGFLDQRVATRRSPTPTGATPSGPTTGDA